MKNLLASLLLAPLSLCADVDSFSVYKNAGMQGGKFKSFIQVEGTRYFEVSPSRVFFLDGVVQGMYGSNFSSSFGAGAREFFDTFGIGINAYWDYTAENKFSINQIGIGAEFIMDQFTIFFNKNIPLTKDKSSQLYEIQLASSSQLGFKHQVSRDISYSLSTNICCFNNKLGFKAECEKTFFNNLSVGCAFTYTGDKKPGAIVSLGYHFGGADDKRLKKVTRDRRVCYKATSAGIRKENDKFIVVPVDEQKKQENNQNFSLFDWSNPILSKWWNDATAGKK